MSRVVNRPNESNATNKGCLLLVILHYIPYWDNNQGDELYKKLKCSIPVSAGDSSSQQCNDQREYC